MFNPFDSFGWTVITRPQGEGYSEYLYRKLDCRVAKRRLAKNAEIERREAERWLAFQARCRAVRRQGGKV
jgi:hypothetical protein